MDLGTVTDKLLERNIKRLILMCMDTCLIIVSMILSRLFLDVIIDIPDERFILAVLFVLIFYLIISVRLKVFSLITRYTGYQSYVKIGLSLISAYSLFLIISMILWQTFSYCFILVSLFLSYVMLITPRIVWKVLHETRKMPFERRITH